ncbi:M90 family metallopeptidase [Ascidiaceihabitans sp.]|uniref:M90 family metallopeptidase n=1 Tax=Ascidiaceihabitans sp. TaxID=1872644 RepID=UPI003299F77A
MTLFLALAICTFAAIFFWRRHTAQKQRDLLQSRLSDAQRALISRHVPMIDMLPPETRAKLDGKIALFLDQVDFGGCNELDVTDEMRLSIAAQACLLVVNTDLWYGNLTTILIYPSAFKSKNITHDGRVVREAETVRLGESWSGGPVILSWADSAQGALNNEDGHNVVLHEFAHQIDDMTGKTNGIPVLPDGQSLAEWGRVMAAAFERHSSDTQAGRKTVIDPYGATGYEEFFATSVEVFFEKPEQFKRDEPQVYAQLAALFNLDPATWDA